MSSVELAMEFEIIGVQIVKRFFLAFFTSTAVLLAAAEPEWQVSTRGYGQVRAGMPIVDAERLLGTRIQTQDGRPIETSCDQLVPQSGHRGISLMVEKGRIAHVQITDANIRTRSGAAIGDTVAKLRQLYGSQLEIQQHKYDDTGFYYFVWEQDRRHGVKFEIADGKVVAIYAGDYTIGYVEGCA